MPEEAPQGKYTEQMEAERSEITIGVLSAAEEQTIQNFQNVADITNYAKQFSSTKALAVLWHGTINRDNQFTN